MDSLPRLLDRGKKEVKMFGESLPQLSLISQNVPQLFLLMFLIVNAYCISVAHSGYLGLAVFRLKPLLPLTFYSYMRFLFLV